MQDQPGGCAYLAGGLGLAAPGHVQISQYMDRKLTTDTCLTDGQTGSRQRNRQTDRKADSATHASKRRASRQPCTQ